LTATSSNCMTRRTRGRVILRDDGSRRD
jgi:hypothetical protein